MSTLSELVLCLRKEKIGEQRRTLTDFFRSLLNVQRYSYVGRAYMGPVEKKRTVSKRHISGRNGGEN